jgi:ubiquinone/menaquinone biosynthesis C-methylase UbiE
VALEELSEKQRAQRRQTFNDVAAAYDAVRPRYPDALFATLFSLFETDHPRIVEIGCGTGQATEPLLRRGGRVTAIELGDSMAALARDRVAEYAEQFDVIVDSFENVHLPAHDADCVVAATSFHWIEPEYALSECARILKPDGILAVWRIVDAPVPPGQPDFIAASQSIYRELGIATDDDQYVPFGPGARPPEYVQQIQHSPLFTGARIHRFPSNQRLTTDQYIAQRKTHSDVLTLDDGIREQLLSRLAALSDEEFGGSFVRYAETVMCTARPNLALPVQRLTIET